MPAAVFLLKRIESNLIPDTRASVDSSVYRLLRNDRVTEIHPYVKLFEKMKQSMLMLLYKQ